MTITAEAILQVAQIAVLTGIFFRLGHFGAAIDGLKNRLEKLEDKVWKT